MIDKKIPLPIWIMVILSALLVGMIATVLIVDHHLHCEKCNPKVKNELPKLPDFPQSDETISI